jgi:hypothetical protein|tara:strand:- start:10 stop:870 length:861 start_codon:yes stop_codon:yes gene_type:complete
MKEPNRPIAWANFLRNAWGNHFPVDVKMIAMDYSQRYDDPIKKIQPAELDSFEGALFPLRKSGKWAILYNPNIRESGRINFTIAHELGHYLSHRQMRPSGFECGEAKVLGIDEASSDRAIENEADAFASYLLMPLDDYRNQVGGNEMSLDLLNHMADRYDVSRTAAAIKWLDFTPRRAMLVVATNGFVLWCWRSKAAKRSRLFFERGMQLPSGSLAANRALAENASDLGVQLAPNIWPVQSDVREMAILADNYEMTISLLVFDDAPPNNFGFEEDVDDDVYDRFSR